MLQADSELRYVRGVGPRRADRLQDLALETVEDLLYVQPSRYEDRRSFARTDQMLPGGSPATLSVRITKPHLIRTRRRGFTLFRAELVDSHGTLPVVWYNQAYLNTILTEGREAVVYGAAAMNRRLGVVLENPEFELLDDEDTESVHTGRIVPVYRKLADLTSRMQRALIHRVLADLDDASFSVTVPDDVRDRLNLLPRGVALRQTHFPQADVSLRDLAERSTPAQRSLIFEEIYLLQLALALRRYGIRHERRGIAYELTDALRTRLASMLPFRLTEAQKRVLREIGGDLRSDHPMNRLLQGDVGSGKTIVALLTLLVAVENGYQAAVMAPTEILTEQHYRNFRSMLDAGGVPAKTVLLTGSLRAAERRETLRSIAEGEAQIVVGTHSLLQGGVEFQRLGLVVIDEQHRFGVMQRAALAGKGPRPDMLVMTATPIPRTLALTLYGDLDLSVIDELPPGRTPVRTALRREMDRERVYGRLRQEIENQGRQVYVVVPLAEETERSDLKAATAFAEELRDGVFDGLRVGIVHGKLKSADKDRVMEEFREGRLQVLVATTVIEVGVDVANATVMVVEHAERFGLSQLHQLRGRVGRGSKQSYCLLMVGGEDHGDVARERLSVMCETNDGFRIAEKDLEIRGPGAVFGTQQHGAGDLRFLAEILRDPELLETARGAAELAVSDEAESRAAAQRTLDALGARWKRRLDLARVG